MANTNDLKQIEPYVRKWLRKEFHKEFLPNEIALPLRTGGKHKFDAISRDRSIVAGIKSNHPRPEKKVGVGVVDSSLVELYYLSLVKAKRKFLIFTNKDFYEILKRRLEGKILPDTKILYCKLSKKAASIAARAAKSARREIMKRK